MSEFVEGLVTFVDAVAIVVALVFVVSVLHRHRKHNVSNDLLLGAVFSFAILISMSDPIVLPYDTGIFDMRVLLVGTAAGILGPMVGLLSFSTAVTYRLLIGGAGTFAGIVGITAGLIMGLLWRYTIRESALPLWAKSLLLGLFLSTQVVAIFFAPPAAWTGLFSSLGPYMVLSSFAGSMIFNHLLSGELSFLSAAQISREQAETDHLTGLLNRRGLENFENKPNKRWQNSIGRGVVYFDIDRFKITNDTYGHAIGDQLLRHVVDHIRLELREDDTFVRLGGDEFAIILPQLTEEQVQKISGRCRSAVERSEFMINGQKVPVSISVGAVWSDKLNTVESLLKLADCALYQAKDRGRNRVVYLTETNASQLLAA